MACSFSAIFWRYLYKENYFWSIVFFSSLLQPFLSCSETLESCFLLGLLFFYSASLIRKMEPFFYLCVCFFSSSYLFSYHITNAPFWLGVKNTPTASSRNDLHPKNMLSVNCTYVCCLIRLQIGHMVTRFYCRVNHIQIYIFDSYINHIYIYIFDSRAKKKDIFYILFLHWESTGSRFTLFTPSGN